MCDADRCKEIIRSAGLSAPCAFRASVSSGLPPGLFLFPEDVLKKGKLYKYNVKRLLLPALKDGVSAAGRI